MGLQERRRIKQLEDEAFPYLRNQFSELCGGSVEIAADWSSFTTMSALDDVEHQALGRIWSAFRSLCRDDLGKEAVRAIAKVELKQLPAPPKSLALKDGTLSVHAVWGENGDLFQDSDIESFLEKEL